MRRFLTLAGAALIAFAAISAIAPSHAQAQVIAVQFGRPYTPPYIPAQVYYPPGYIVPVIAPSYPSTISFAPQSTAVYSYYAPPTYVVPAAGVYTTRTVETYGIFRPRVIVTDRYYTPYLP